MTLKLALKKILSPKLFLLLLKIVILLLQALTCSLILWQREIFPQKFKLGQKSPINVISTKSLKIIDKPKTQKAQEKYKEKIFNEYLKRPLYEKDNSKNKKSLVKLEKLTAEIDLFYKTKNREKVPDFIREEINKIKPNSWEKLKKQIVPLGKFVLKQDFVGQVSPELIESFFKSLKSKKTQDPRETLFLKLILEETLEANFKLKTDNLQELQTKSKQDLPVVYKQVPARTLLIRQNELITQEKLEILEKLSLQDQELELEKFLRALLLCIFFILFFVLQIKLEKLYLDFKRIFLLCFLITSSTLLAFFIHEYSDNLIPIASLAMFISLFFKPSLGLSVAILFSGLCIYGLSLDPISLMPSIISSVISVIFCQRAKNRAEISQSGIYISASAVLTYFLTCLFFGLVNFSLSHLFLLAISGLLMAFIVAGGMPYLESLFSLVTRFRLLELSDFKQPLLQRLQEEAPGTFEHTLIVADLAQQAAKKLDLNHELVRVGVLYHDIGKLHNPSIFIENQFDQINPHNQLSYEKSAQEIIKHVTEGIKLAKKHKLPQAVIDFIPMHQGSARAGYFYEKACQKEPKLKLQAEIEKKFRYPGPIPQSPETAIVMLADTCEATIRSLRQVENPEQVIETIKLMIENRVKDGQLREARLSSDNLRVIELSFFESWKNKNHGRLAYKID